MPSQPSGLLGENCQNSIGTPTCGDGQACVQEMNTDQGFGLCEAYCDPKIVGACPQAYSCVAVGVGLHPGAPLIHVCQVTQSDAGFPGLDSGLGPSDVVAIPDVVVGHFVDVGQP